MATWRVGAINALPVICILTTCTDVHRSQKFTQHLFPLPGWQRSTAAINAWSDTLETSIWKYICGKLSQICCKYWNWCMKISGQFQASFSAPNWPTTEICTFWKGKQNRRLKHNSLNGDLNGIILLSKTFYGFRLVSEEILWQKNRNLGFYSKTKSDPFLCPRTV